jgi:hypothetical protein
LEKVEVGAGELFPFYFGTPTYVTERESCGGQVLVLFQSNCGGPLSSALPLPACWLLFVVLQKFKAFNVVCYGPLLLSSKAVLVLLQKSKGVVLCGLVP